MTPTLLLALAAVLAVTTLPAILFVTYIYRRQAGQLDEAMRILASQGYREFAATRHLERQVELRQVDEATRQRVLEEHELRQAEADPLGIARGE